jgi:hypothetical protein
MKWYRGTGFDRAVADLAYGCWNEHLDLLPDVVDYQLRWHGYKMRAYALEQDCSFGIVVRRNGTVRRYQILCSPGDSEYSRALGLPDGETSWFVEATVVLPVTAQDRAKLNED